MSRVYDNWEKLVGAVLDREKLRRLALSESFSSSISADFSSDISHEDVTAEMLEKLPDELKIEKNKKRKDIKGTVVLMKNVVGVTDVGTSIRDRFQKLFGKGISLQLISAVHFDPANMKRGKLGKEAYLEDRVSKFNLLTAEDYATFNISFNWDESLGVPGAFIIRNHHPSQIYLKTVTLDNVPGHGQVHFLCDSWVYPIHRYKHDRVFFSNQTYLPGDTPWPLRSYREQELINLQGNGSGMLKEWDRVYDYAYYNDLGIPEKGQVYARPVLGGSKYPYPRRVRTGRQPNKKDPNCESRLSLLSLDMYVPRDERFNVLKFSDYIGYVLKSLAQVLASATKAAFNEFDTVEDVLKLYESGIKLPDGDSLNKIRGFLPWDLLKRHFRSDGTRFLKFSMPDIIKEDKTAWRTDEEFGREMLAGVNPVIIRRLQEFPPKSKLDRQEYGNHDSSITKEHIEKNMNGLTVDEAIENSKLFILDHHDTLMPYLRRINTTTTKTYASRTILLLQDNGSLKPVAIELSLPHEEGDSQGPISEVFTPSGHGVGNSIWQLAKAYVAVNDSGYHQLISHWLNTHAVMEPFIIASNRQLSVLHPIYKLLKPHFHDTLHINALARQILINAGGVLEKTVFPERYALEMSSAIYRNWNFVQQALPEDLIERGVAVPDPSQRHGLRLLIEDYPFAVDGLEIWSAIEAWVKEYCSIYYPTDEIIQVDTELQSWWKEIREVGHGDLKDKPWWPKMQTWAELIKSCTTIIWIASALHAAVNFGQYSYAGYLPNRPTLSRRFMPKPGTPEYTELEVDPDRAFLKTITPQFESLLAVSLIEIMSRHSTDEIYLGQREAPNWTTHDQVLEAFKRFSEALINIETKITERNSDVRLRNRCGPVYVPYTLLYPNTSDCSKMGGLTGRGIPNSVSM